VLQFNSIPTLRYPAEWCPWTHQARARELETSAARRLKHQSRRRWVWVSRFVYPTTMRWSFITSYIEPNSLNIWGFCSGITVCGISICTHVLAGRAFRISAAPILDIRRFQGLTTVDGKGPRLNRFSDSNTLQQVYSLHSLHDWDHSCVWDVTGCVTI